MLELLKLLMDGLVLRDSARKGLVTWKVMLTGFGLVVFLYGTALPALLLYQRNPRYEWLVIATLCVDAVSLVVVMFFGIRWYFEATARRKEQDAAAVARYALSARGDQKSTAIDPKNAMGSS